MYEVFLERRAERDLKKLSQAMFYRVIPQIKDLSENPKPLGCRKITGSKNDWRIRIASLPSSFVAISHQLLCFLASQRLSFLAASNLEPRTHL